MTNHITNVNMRRSIRKKTWLYFKHDKMVFLDARRSCIHCPKCTHASYTPSSVVLVHVLFCCFFYICSQIWNCSWDNMIITKKIIVKRWKNPLTLVFKYFPVMLYVVFFSPLIGSTTMIVWFLKSLIFPCTLAKIRFL